MDTKCPDCQVICNNVVGWCGCSCCPGCKRDGMVSLQNRWKTDDNLFG